ncbi:MAG: AbrB family transcriptional regulator [Methanothrix sp.]|nr:AbrB family transcriptional regulator [Methanothrix sp.]
MGAIEMPVTKLDDKGRILLPGDIRKTGVLKKIDLRSMLKEAIERAKSIDHEKVEREIEEESNQLARKRFEVCPRSRNRR